MKNKFFLIIPCSILCAVVGLIIGFIAFNPEAEVSAVTVATSVLTATGTPIPTNTPTQIPTYSPICNGIDISEMTREEVEGLISVPDNTFSETELRQITFDAISCLPDNVQEKYSVSDIMLVDDEQFTYGFSLIKGSYVIWFNSSTTNPTFDVYAAIGDLIDKSLGNVSNSAEWLVVWENEHENEFHLTEDATTSFAYQFADYVMGSYAGCYNSIHTPKMYTYIDNIRKNFEAEYAKGQIRKELQYQKAYAESCFLNLWDTYNEQYGVDQHSRMEHAITLLPEEVQEFVSTQDIIWTLEDEILMEGGYYAGIIFYKNRGARKDTEIKILKDYRAMEHTVAHELGHLVDWYILQETGRDICEEFKSVCESEFYSTTLKYDTYNEDEIREYFADSFSYCTSACEEMQDYYKENCPEIYKFIWDAINQLATLS